jgi:rhamnulokinase
MPGRTVLSIDLGAESGRVVAVNFDGQQLAFEELHRFRNTPVTARDTLYWDFLRLWGEIQAGIEKGRALHPASLGVDAWGVDFGLLDGQGSLVGNPVHYRDGRTQGMMELAFARLPRNEIFFQTGIQFMPINTLYQLLSLVECSSPHLQIAATFLTIPDLFNYMLTGAKVCEFSNATTTQLFNPTGGQWASGVMDSLGIPSSIFPEIVPPGTRLGAFEGIPVIAPACHDTGSAVAAVPARQPEYAYISSGTWSLVGLEVDQPLLTEEALSANVTNEGGVYGTYRLLKNVIGLWILQQCRAAWESAGRYYSYQELVDLAAHAQPLKSIFDADDPVFLSPGDHPQHIRDWCRRTNQPVPESPGAVVRSVLESLALAYRRVLDLVCAVANRRISVIHILGGGTQNQLLNQMTADATGLPVIAGPVEATLLGNALVQLITLGEISDLRQGRQVLSTMPGLKNFDPHSSQKPAWDEAYGRFQSALALR